MSTPPRRRASDQLVVPMFLAGVICLLIAGAIALITALKGAAFTTPIVIAIGIFAFAAGLLMIPEPVLRAIGIWRRHGRTDPPAS